MTLNDTYYLNRSGRYANPLNSNDKLPAVYGDLTDSTSGNWILPCIDTVNFVYCYSAQEALSIAAGNGINIYKDGVLVNPANYTFNENNNYESEGSIATITFTSDQENSVISARGKGKPTTSGGATLMTDIVDIAYDFLTVRNTAWTSADFNIGKKAQASQIFQTAGYKAAGVINEDIEIWTLLQQMMASFLGKVYLDGYGLICFDIDNGVVSESEYAAIIPTSHIDFVSAVQKLENVINQCPCSYAYNYAKGGEFKSHTDDMAHADISSQGIYGIRKPTEPYRFYWCRDTTTVHAVQDIIVNKYKDPDNAWEVTFDDNTSQAIHTDVNDLIIATIDRLYDKRGSQRTNPIWRTVTITPDLQTGKIRFIVQDTGYYLYATYYADGSYPANGSIHAGSDRDLTVY